MQVCKRCKRCNARADLACYRWSGDTYAAGLAWPEAPTHYLCSDCAELTREDEELWERYGAEEMLVIA